MERVLAAAYERHLLPRLVHLACGLKPAMRQRRRIVPRARGRVLEIGLGSGLNLPLYEAGRVTRVIGLDPSSEMWDRAQVDPGGLPFSFERVQAGGEAVPLRSGSVDTVVVTYSLCTIPDVAASLAEARRVLARRGRLLFCEHGRAPDEGVRRWQGRLDPFWCRLAGGCHLGRDIPGLIEAAGFRCEELESGYIRGWKPASFNYWGVARPAGSR